MKVEQHYGILLLILLSLLSACYSRFCPSNIVPEVFKCLYNLTMLGGSSFLVAGDDISHVRQKCSDGSFKSTSNCIKSLLRSCRGTRHNIVKQLVDIRRMQKSFTQFCDRVDEYEESSSCIRAVNYKIKPCIEDQMNMFQHDNAEDKTVEETVQLVCRFYRTMTVCIDEPVRHYCSSRAADLLLHFMIGLGFYRTMTVCIDEPVRHYCSSRAADLLLHFMIGFTPPVCANANYKFVTGSTAALRHNALHSHVLLLLLPCLAYVLNHRRL